MPLRIFFLLCLVLSLTICGAAEAAPQITADRFAVHTDAVDGGKKLRLAVDLSEPLQPSVSLSGQNLVLEFKGASLAVQDGVKRLDGRIAVNRTLSRSNDGVRLNIKLAAPISDNDYKVFILPASTSASKTSRAVIDITPAAPSPERSYNFTPGLKGKTIVIDPGHGGSDPGAIGKTGVREKNVALAVSLKLRDILQAGGAKLIMTRTTDRDVFAANASGSDELGARAAIGNNNNADLLISIHANSFRDPDVKGTSVYYYGQSPYSRLLAQTVQYGAVKNGGLSDRGIYPANFYVLRRTLMPAVLVETAFISNPAEEALLNNPQFQQRLAQGIADGIANFFNQAATMGR